MTGGEPPIAGLYEAAITRQLEEALAQSDDGANPSFVVGRRRIGAFAQTGGCAVCRGPRGRLRIVAETRGRLPATR